MQPKHILLCVVLVLVLLAPIGILPIGAEDDIPMWVHRARLAYTGRSPHGEDLMVAHIHIRDANNSMVEGAAVTAQWTSPNGEQTLTQTTDAQGVAEFVLWEGPGTYTLCVLYVVKAGWAYDSALDRETCPTFVVP